MTVLWVVLAALAGGVVGWLARRPDAAGGEAPGDGGLEAALRALAADLEVGRRPSAPPPGAPPAVTALHRALDEGWAPVDEERERALREALGRVHGFLEARVREPLVAGTQGDAEALRAAARQALGAVEDLEFFLREPLTASETTDVAARVGQVAAEYEEDWAVAVEVQNPSAPLLAHVHPAAFMDAVYLLLHNAGTFGGGAPVEVRLGRESARVRVEIRDRGPGFSREALERAHELFYSTAPAGLGLGIPFARRVVEGAGGEVELRNLDAGGASVTVWLPAA